MAANHQDQGAKPPLTLRVIHPKKKNACKGWVYFMSKTNGNRRTGGEKGRGISRQSHSPDLFPFFCSVFLMR